MDYKRSPMAVACRRPSTWHMVLEPAWLAPAIVETPRISLVFIGKLVLLYRNGEMPLIFRDDSRFIDDLKVAGRLIVCFGQS
jgi:hypothetical protein